MMLEVEPAVLVIRDVRLNQPYTASLCVTNSLAAGVEFTLRPSSPRWTITPNRVNLGAGQSIVVTVRLFLSHYPNYGRGVQGQEDTIHIKSSYFEQKVSATFFLHSRDSSTTTATIRAQSQSPQRHRGSSVEIITELQAQLQLKDEKIKVMEDTIGQLESKYPSMRQIIANRIEQERSVFEEKSEKVRINYNCLFCCCFH